MPVAKKTKSPTKTQREVIKRNRRVGIYGSFSGETTKLHRDVAKVLGRKKLTLISGGRLGPTGDVIKEALGRGAKNISVIVEPWAKEFNQNIAGKARNITAKETKSTGARELHNRLGLLQNSKVKAYVFLPGNKGKQFSGTMLELQSIVNAYTIEHLTKKIRRRPILLIGEEWKSTYEQIRRDYAKQWPKIGRYIRVITDSKQLENIL
jgi:hypothetical protein